MLIRALGCPLIPTMPLKFVFHVILMLMLVDYFIRYAARVALILQLKNKNMEEPSL
jgi:quinol-cytochrome oxidoreductase complex cytochrome b subunit